MSTEDFDALNPRQKEAFAREYWNVEVAAKRRLLTIKETSRLMDELFGGNRTQKYSTTEGNTPAKIEKLKSEKPKSEQPKSEKLKSEKRTGGGTGSEARGARIDGSRARK